MATCPVRFEFYCGEEELKYTHNITRSLVTVGPQVVQVAGYRNLFVKEIQSIMKEHEAACLATSNASCENCGSPRTTVLQTPMLGPCKIVCSREVMLELPWLWRSQLLFG